MSNRYLQRSTSTSVNGDLAVPFHIHPMTNLLVLPWKYTQNSRTSLGQASIRAHLFAIASQPDSWSCYTTAKMVRVPCKSNHVLPMNSVSVPGPPWPEAPPCVSPSRTGKRKPTSKLPLLPQTPHSLQALTPGGLQLHPKPASPQDSCSCGSRGWLPPLSEGTPLTASSRSKIREHSLCCFVFFFKFSVKSTISKYKTGEEGHNSNPPG